MEPSDEQSSNGLVHSDAIKKRKKLRLVQRDPEKVEPYTKRSSIKSKNQEETEISKNHNQPCPTTLLTTILAMGFYLPQVREVRETLYKPP